MNDTNFLRRMWEQMKAGMETFENKQQGQPPPSSNPNLLFGEYSYLSDNGIIVYRESVEVSTTDSVDTLVDALNTLLEKLTQSLNHQPCTDRSGKSADVAIYLTDNGRSQLVTLIGFHQTWAAAYKDVTETLKFLTNRIGAGEATSV